MAGSGKNQRRRSQAWWHGSGEEGPNMWDREREKRRFSEMRKPEGKTSLGEYNKVSRASWAERGGGGLQGKRASAGELGRLGQIPGEDSNGN
jgi:hypothetical protein